MTEVAHLLPIVPEERMWTSIWALKGKADYSLLQV